MSTREQLTATTDQGSVLWTLEEIGRLVSQSGNPAETLNNIVHLIQRRFDTDVCSVYLLEPDRANLVLAATIGLRPESVGRVRMRLTEGLAGLVAEQLRPQVRRRRDAASALQVLPRGRRGSLSLVPRRADHRSRPAAGRAGRADGRDRATFSQDDVRMLTTAGAQLAPIVSEARDARAVRRAGASSGSRARAEPVVELGQRHDQPVPRARSGAVARARPQSGRAAAADSRSSELEERASAARAAQPDQLRLPPHAGVPEVDAHVGRAPRRRAVGAAGRLLLGRVRPARVAADLLGRPRHPGRRPHQERVGPRHPARRRRPVLRPGLFPAAARLDGWQHEDYLDVDSRAAADPAGDRATASRSRSRSRPAPARSPRASGSCRSGATRCCCSTRTSRATSPRIAS